MPWTREDVEKHKKGLNSSSKSKWAEIANSVLARTGDEASAIRIANSKTAPSQGAIKRRLRRQHG